MIPKCKLNTVTIQLKLALGNSQRTKVSTTKSNRIYAHVFSVTHFRVFTHTMTIVTMDPLLQMYAHPGMQLSMISQSAKVIAVE